MTTRFDEALPDELSWLADVHEWIRRICDASLGPARETIVRDELPGEWGGQGSMAASLAGAHTILFAFDGDQRDLDIAREYLLLPANVHTFLSGAFYHAVTTLRTANLLSESDEERIRCSALPAAKGGTTHFSHHYGWRRANHPVTAASLCDVYARLWSDAPESPVFRSRADEIWSEWFQFGDNLEDAANYEAFAQVTLIEWAERRGELSGFLEHPGTRQWIRRGNEQMLPIGLVPGYGDTCTMELWQDWFGFYGLLTAVESGREARRARWNAERMFVWGRNRDWIRNTEIINEVSDDLYRARQAWGQIPRAAWFLALGARYLLSNRARNVVPEPPQATATVTQRWNELHRIDLDGSWSTVSSRPGAALNDKAILRLGIESDSPQAMVALAPQMWHDHTDSGAILNYTFGGVVLLDSPGYMQRYPIFHNLFWAADADADFFAYGEKDIVQNRHVAYDVAGITGTRAAQMLTIRGDTHHGLPIRSKRRVLLARSGAMVVVDSIIPFVGGLVGSPLWHTQTVHSSGVAGSTSWAEVSIDEFRGMNGPAFPNAEGSVIIADPLNPDGWDVSDLDNPDPYNSPHYVEPVTRYFVYWKASFVTRKCVHRPRPLQRGAQNRFVTVLVPAENVASPEAAVQRIDPIQDDVVACRVGSGIFVHNDGSNTVRSAWGESDANTLWLEPDALLAHRVKHLVSEHVEIDCDARYVDVDLVWNNDHISGTASAERDTPVRFVVRTTSGKAERTINVAGITEVAFDFAR